MKLSGALMEMETAIPLWNISERYGQSWPLKHFIVILKQSGGVVINGTDKKYEFETNFFPFDIRMPFCIFDFRGSLLDNL